ncbi:TMEM175 family protein [Hymenobacter cellulosivorans]|uniref:TMEM175 family protein n=1 Tax=Hymenobacter cellulosivorans TaxID=2932249 RepID=A0ABY4FE65_9BACT|nr:TMEM175 family protein [Hymenobacter cellulosivorans]UOQ54303.1 TMEM175 family protein [Hymenobacter cellulosivorans]
MDGNEKAQHNRDAFQIERVILFTDAVFAIAITLLVIEIKVPELEHPTEQGVQSILAHLIPKFVGFFLSFFIIAIYWTAHHRIFRFVRRLDNRLLWLNLLFLLSIILMPFTTAYQSEYSLLRTPWILYSINIAFTGIMQIVLQRHLSNARHELVAAPEHEHPDLDIARPLMSPVVFISSIALAFVLPPIALRMIPAVAFPLLAFLNRRRYRRLEATYRQKHGTRALA